MNIILIGAPGSGKGTQASLLAKEYSIEHISTGDLLRNEVQLGTEVGVLAKVVMDSGGLVGDDIILRMIKDKVLSDSCKGGFILDGFPRSLSQAEGLDKILIGVNRKINKVFNFVVEDEVIIKRIAGRYFCKKCGTVYNRYFNPSCRDGEYCKCGSLEFDSRSDDNEQTVKNRLLLFKEYSDPLVEYYKKKLLLVSVDALKNPSLIFEDIKLIITNLN